MFCLSLIDLIFLKGFVLADDLDYLDDKHCIFGQVTEGDDTLERLNEQLCDGENHPYRDIRFVTAVMVFGVFLVKFSLHFTSF